MDGVLKMQTAYLVQKNEKEEGTSKGDSFWANCDGIFRNRNDAMKKAMAMSLGSKSSEFRVIELSENGHRWNVSITEENPKCKK